MWRWTKKAKPTLTLGESVTINGNIILHRPVKLVLATEQQLNKVINRFASE
jgi:hypothetical protein